MSAAELEALFGQSGRVALCTGASSGLGSECAAALAKAGAQVGLVARRAERLEELGRDLAGRFGVKTCAAPADLTERAQIEAAIERVETELGPIDVLVHGAGVAPLSRAFKHSREKWDLAVATNLTSAFEISQAMARRWIERERGGCLIHLSSVMGRVANAVHHAVGYAATKGGLDNLVRHLAVEWAAHGIRVNAVAPAYFPTEMTVDPRTGEVPADHVERMRQFTPLDRLGRPGELESAILFLAAPASSYVTGSIVAVDGGWTAW